MKVKEVTISAVIPTAQYSNLQPSITVEVDDDVEVAKQLAMSHIIGISQKYAESGKALKGSQGQKLTAFVGGDIFYDDISHTYTNEEGEVYLSGSQYANQFTKPFDKDMMSNVVAKKFNVDASDVKKMWELKSQISMGFGTAIHGALELYGKYRGLSEAMEKETHLHDHPIIKKAVEGFYEARKDEKAEYEVLVVDHARKWAGQIDRLVITGKNSCIVEDYKTNGEMKPDKLKAYWKQLSFYASILQAGGWTVEGLRIHHWNGTWTKHESEVLPV